MAPDGADAAQTDIYSANPDGSNLKRLTTSAPDAAGNVQPQGSPALSPDRRQIAYVSVAFVDGQSEARLRIMNVDGSNARALTSDANALGATTPTWSPDGTRLAFSRGNDGLWIIGADGSNLRQLTDAGANPSWNAANRIAFNAAPGVRVVAAGALTRRVVSAASDQLSATKSTGKGRQASGVLPPTTDSYTDIYTVGADGSNLRQVTQRSQSATGLASINPAWSRDGRTLVFNSLPGSGVPAQLFLINEDGSNRRALGDRSGNDAVWSPDGTRIAYSDETGLLIVDSSGSNAVKLGAPDGFFVEDTDWK